MTAWNSETSALQARVRDYRAQAPTTAVLDDCQRELSRYAEDVRPRLTRMQAMSRGMDECMSAMGRLSEADLAATCAAMDAELERYANEGCRSVDAARNRADAEAHCDQMLEYLDRSTMRSQSMSWMMGSGMMAGGICR
ncbi:MAG: hypothetical protein ACOZIN_12120 [Myxococcota bacterium]